MNNSREFQLIIKEGDPKLTITPTRITVKVPADCLLTDLYVKYAQVISNLIDLNNTPLRGRFQQDNITLYTDKKKHSTAFYYQDLDKNIT